MQLAKEMCAADQATAESEQEDEAEKHMRGKVPPGHAYQ